ncbi:winged helix-turn-helix domain-containing protein [Mycobacterium dioxanotrophicus]|uniref:Winged helix-turn-helix domain-containing protein n=1 Tax=Mycobacterium dioxanotrophicus TaxID=482462 RepID=A0A1Y0CDH1_9MYCO|nr:winged helix-turn-helix domain-containing protein [Mycobacterium dioxanotrophicus]ART73310.1 winged helix-turn-helix domain-containing protein [Mycobacterium dioxanotrophicus]
MSTDVADAQQRLTARAARQRIDERELERAIYQAANHAGLSQRQISDIVGIHSQATVQRILRRLTEDPALLEERPAEIIDRRAAGLINTKDMMDRLLNWRYSFGGVVRIDGVATDAYATGDWDEIEMAFYRGLLSDDEFQALAARHLKSMGSGLGG